MQDQLEAPEVKYIMMEASKQKMRLLRNNRGLFLTLDGARKVRAGLEAPGSSDLIGIITITITPEMVGAKVGIAAVCEVKRPGWKFTGTEHEIEQENFINQVKKRGGIGFFLNNAKNLKNMIDEALKVYYKS